MTRPESIPLLVAAWALANAALFIPDSVNLAAQLAAVVEAITQDPLSSLVFELILLGLCLAIQVLLSTLGRKFGVSKAGIAVGYILLPAVLVLVFGIWFMNLMLV